MLIFLLGRLVLWATKLTGVNYASGDYENQIIPNAMVRRTGNFKLTHYPKLAEVCSRNASFCSRCWLL